jgi:hypothetical protein
MPERSAPAGDPDVGGLRVEGVASCTRPEKMVHAKTAAVANTANAITMAVTRRLAEGPEGDAAGGLSTPDHLHDHWDWDHSRAVPGGPLLHSSIVERDLGLRESAVSEGCFDDPNERDWDVTLRRNLDGIGA